MGPLSCCFAHACLQESCVRNSRRGLFYTSVPLCCCAISLWQTVHVIMQRDKGKHQLHLELVGRVTEGVTLAHLHAPVVLKSLCWKLLPGSCSTAQSDGSQPRSSWVVCAREGEWGEDLVLLHL